MEIKTLEGVTTERILTVFNESFSDYFIPFQLTEEQLTLKMFADKTDLQLSVGVFDNDKLVAFILHGFDIVNKKKVAYNGGTGVIPEKRGAGLTKQMYRFVEPILAKRGIEKVVLEVISKNKQAITSYEKSGFITKRNLVCYKGKVEKLEINNTIEIKEFQEYNWKLMESFWDIKPTWQNSKNVLDTIKENTISLGAYLDNKLVGYVIHNTTSNRTHQIAVSKDHRNKKIACTLISKLKETYGDSFLIINVDKNAKNTNSFFESIGLKNDLEQLEMEKI
ncbi:GNAT family N-acetyltransferase [Aquimarina litoralis]|uniref:GNAT family N-acetyltransferase n=1 Tax=Aquimarina litoralis TaxID=584605 RepID=UPI001C56A95D|nr:GNAT family N-acetyltransferase [Aquimarina litoralis]MBW1294752.1 GNAT family N-acetyltransferase [Aquimarina litoralis]